MMILLPKAACKDCDKRHIGCHAECEDYKAFKAEMDKIHAKRDATNEYYLLRRDMNNVRRHMDHHKKRRESIV